MQFSLQVFETEDHNNFRTIDVEGVPWFVLADVCRALDIKNPSDAAARLDSDEKMTLALAEGQSGVRGGPRSMNVINESGLYSLIVRSDKPSAKRFRKWVTSEVLPAIRKTGSFNARRGSFAFLKRFGENFDRVDTGYFSVINELVVRVWGRLELAGYAMRDRGPDGKELRPDISVGRGFADWLRENHSEFDGISYYLHKTPQWEGEARQYPNAIVPLFWQYVDEVWIPECAEAYFKKRDPAALAYLPKLLPSYGKAKAGMMRIPTRISRRERPTL